ncbi:MAG: hypothetical protein AAF539_12665, partial [Planctomycetota bacterium]
GDFVDLFYPFLAGTPLLNRMGQAGAGFAPSPPVAGAFNTVVNANYSSFLQSDLSGLPLPIVTLAPIKRSGKLVHTDAGTGAIVYFQPTYDTWTDFYEVDGFDQTQTFLGGTGPQTQIGSRWVLNDLGIATSNPRLPDLSGPPPPIPANHFPAAQVDSGKYVPENPETSPPIQIDLPAIQVSVRVEDPASHEMTQFSIVEGLQ